MCQANLIGHWLDGASTAKERRRRKKALEAIVRVDQHGRRSWDGPAVLDLSRHWGASFDWVPGRDRGILVHDLRGRLIEQTALARMLLRP